ncbi:competence protein ComG [Staphylococcus devriesei]|uniref:Competence protein ComG n=1 Tax=Staphylococcus devriesei TaxID=586733 RepID=A0A2K4DGW9_9STAP|nr:competence protein ComG [Staphylococcus devriesei]PTF12252.1 competence protein ComG [Staphylococcus devriesei]PTF15469.1 competence protein ComG [Staphylococcus devriesei]
MTLNFLKTLYVTMICLLTKKFALSTKLKAFTFIEMALSLLITIIILTLLPNIIKLTNFYFHEAYENNRTEYSFFQADLSHIVNNSHTTLKLENHNSIIVQTKNERNYIKFKNNKLIYENEGRENITLLNNVITAKFHNTNSKVIVINLKIGDANQYYEKTLYI